MVTTTYNLSELHAHASSMRLLPGELNTALASALNETGNTIAQSTRAAIAQQTGLAIATTASFVTSLPATPANLTYEMRVMAGMIETELNSRPLPQRGFPAREVREMPGGSDETKLVNLVTSDDDKVCPICQEISREGPYSMEEFNRLREVHPHLLNRALHCRCSLVPFKPTRPTAGFVGADQAHIDMHTAQADLAANIRMRTRALIKQRGD